VYLGATRRCQGANNLEDLAGNVPLETTKDLRLRETLGGPSRDVGARPRIAPHAHERNDSQRTVCIAISPAIEPVAMLLTGRGVHR
jgi:hypothetical protein